jgi:hypothetical protein
MKDEIKDALRELSSHAGMLTQGQLEFAKGLQHYFARYKSLSEKQLKVLFDIRNSVRELIASEHRLSA